MNNSVLHDSVMFCFSSTCFVFVDARVVQFLSFIFLLTMLLFCFHNSLSYQVIPVKTNKCWTIANLVLSSFKNFFSCHSFYSRIRCFSFHIIYHVLIACFVLPSLVHSNHIRVLLCTCTRHCSKLHKKKNRLVAYSALNWCIQDFFIWELLVF